MIDVSFKMKRGKFNKKGLFFRLLFFPFLVSMLAIVYVYQFAVHAFDIIWYGGEIIYFNNQINRDSLSHMLNYFEQLIKEDKEVE